MRGNIAGGRAFIEKIYCDTWLLLQLTTELPVGMLVDSMQGNLDIRATGNGARRRLASKIPTSSPSKVSLLFGRSGLPYIVGFDVSVSRQSWDVVSKRLSLVSVSRKRAKISVSISSRTENIMSRSRTIGSRLQANMHSFSASLQNCMYIVLNARRLYCLQIHKFTYLLRCKCK